MNGTPYKAIAEQRQDGAKWEAAVETRGQHKEDSDTTYDTVEAALIGAHRMAIKLV